jgi:hypothetical protein
MSLTLVTLAASIVNMAVFEYQNQAIFQDFKMTIFDGGPRCHIDDTCFLVSKQKHLFLE